MNIKHIGQLFFGFLLTFVLVSCDNDSSETVMDTFYPKDAQIYAISLAQRLNTNIEDSVSRAKDSLDCIELGKRNFTIDQKRDIIYNTEKLPYGMDFRKMLVTLSVNSTYGVAAMVVETPDSTYWWNNSDSIDFSKSPVYITIKAAADTLVEKRYRIQLNRYETDPDSIPWKQQINLPSGINQKTLLVGSKFYSFGLDNTTPVLSTFDKETSSAWTTQTISNLPSNYLPSSVVCFRDEFYAIDSDGNTYQSFDGTIWTGVVSGLDIVAIYGVLPAENESDDCILVAIKEGTDYYLGTTTTFKPVNKVQKLYFGAGVVPEFPLSDFAQVSNFNRTDKRSNKMVIVGGTYLQGDPLATTWQVVNTSSGIETTVYNTNEMFEGAGLSVAVYNDKLYVLADKELYTSSNWGGLWTKASEKQHLPSAATTSLWQTLIVDESDYL